MTMIKYSDTVSSAPVDVPKPVVTAPKPAKVEGNEQTSPNTETTRIVKNSASPQGGEPPLAR